MHIPAAMTSSDKLKRRIDNAGDNTSYSFCVMFILTVNVTVIKVDGISRYTHMDLFMSAPAATSPFTTLISASLLPPVVVCEVPSSKSGPMIA